MNDLASILQIGEISPFMMSTEVPPHVELYEQIAQNEKSILEIPEKVLDGVREVVKEHSLGAENISREFLASAISTAIAAVQHRAAGGDSTSQVSKNQIEFEIYQ
ncbi:hypothetical protein AC1031_019509 [Aphanomyces cochlioides]|nr:hypothetical protein AC1031_019509 [Aphanomyces cochlioides]